MGLFCMRTGETILDAIQCAQGNLRLFCEDKCQKRSDYLLRMAIGDLQVALQRLEKSESP